jgi:serine protease Do
MFLRSSLALVFALGCIQAGLCQNADQEQAQALQRTMQKAIDQAQPSIACILVSRSDVYRQLTGQSTHEDKTGKLGDFPPLGEEIPSAERQRIRQKFDLADPAHVPEAFGSGVVIDSQGLILTNYHVVRDATRIFIRLPDGRGSYADIHAADYRSDLAVLRTRDARLLPLKVISLGDASKVQRGQFALTMANPFVAGGFVNGQPSASWGIVSNMRRRPAGTPREDERNRPLFYYATLLQTDTRSQLDCSGSALLNLQGELIGLTNAMAAIHGSETPGGFAIPLDAGVRRILDVLKRGEEVDYGFLGVSFGDPRHDPSKSVQVNSVFRGSPAEKEAHLNVQDAILAVNDIPIKETDDLFLNLGTQLAGTKVTLKVQRLGSRVVSSVDVTLGKFNVPGKSIASSLGKRPFFRGLRVDYTTILVQLPYRFPEVPAGVVVTEVQTGSSADEAQLKTGEVITHVNNRPVTSPASFYQTIAELQGTVECRIYTFGAQEPAKIFLK